MSMCNSAIVLIIFNRPNETKRVLEQIKIAKPKKLYIIADAPRKNVDGEIELNKSCKDLIDNINWECEVIKNYAEENLGCGLRISSGLSWVFSFEEQAIILEDDCLPSPAFFTFCDQMLEKYKNENSVFHISGTRWNEEFNTENDYFFSRYAHIWGWATWSRAWNKYDYHLNSWNHILSKNRLKNHFQGAVEFEFWNEKFKNTFLSTKKTTWDYQWQFTMSINNKLCIIPSKNLISNIGVSGTHLNNLKLSSTKYFNRKVYNDFIVLNEPKDLKYNNSFDKYHFRKHFYNSITKRIGNKLHILKIKLLSNS